MRTDGGIDERGERLMGDQHPPVLERVNRSTRLRDPGWIVLPLRLFLGVTFFYAGVLKLTDPTYLDASSPNSVHAQMVRAARTSPIGPLVSLSAHMATVTGLVIAFGELAVGLGVLLGLWTRLAAAGGLLLSLSFFLTVSWNTRPYFFGSDIVFFFAWSTLLIAGDGGLYTVTNLIRARVRTDMGLRPDRADRPYVAREVERRTVVRIAGLAAVVAGLTVVAGSLSAWAARTRSHGTQPSGPSLAGAGPSRSTASTSPSGAGSSSGTPGTGLGSTADVPVGGAASFSDPRGGGPAYVVHPAAGEFKAFSAVCPHAGCTVNFANGTFVCPCHSSVFDGNTGAVLGGPAPSGLPEIPIKVVGGTIYEI